MSNQVCARSVADHDDGNSGGRISRAKSTRLPGRPKVILVNKYDGIRHQYILAAYYYLLSPDGRVYRAYDELSVPGNDPARFDYAG